MTGTAKERFEVLGIDDYAPDPTENLVDFNNIPALRGILPDIDVHLGRFVVLLDGAPSDNTIAVPGCIAGVCRVDLNIGTNDAWMTLADVKDGDSGKLESSLVGSAQILEKESGTGTVKAIVRLGNLVRPQYWGTLDEDMGSGETKTVSILTGSSLTDSNTNVEANGKLIPSGQELVTGADVIVQQFENGVWYVVNSDTCPTDV
jgi:hypothetical protein